MKKFLCKKCLSNLSLLNVIIRNNKLVCPYCGHTIETDKFKVQQVKKEQDKKKEEISYENKSTDK
jgi:uncharacterized Zn finger protein (UPF0148 family)